MMRQIAVICAAALTISTTQRAEAVGIADCNDISVEVGAQCEVDVAGGCETRCEEIKFVTTCTTKRYNLCRDKCNIEPGSVDCTGGCTASCEADCSVNLGRADCQANCHASCKGDCESYCEASESGVDCAASCKATCSSECYASCEVVPPSADCEAGCEASCEGSCKITAPYIECQTECQEKEYQDCETEMQGGCETQCTTPEGALFCDGQYIDHGNKLDSCVNALNDLLTGNVDVSGETSLECKDGVCTLTIGGEVSTGCSAAPSSATPGMAALGLLLVGAFAARRRRRR